MHYKNILIISISFLCFVTKSQTLYSERFNMLALNTATYYASGSVQTFLYNDLPSAMFSINNDSLVADTLTANYPFRVNGQKLKPFLSYRQANQLDTFAVSTSWLNPIGTADNWMITPTINSIAANTVLSWEAMAPDATNLDGYEVYVTTNTSSFPVVGDFTAINKVFSITSENNTWQKRGLSLAAYAGQNIRIAFKNNSTDKYQLWIDDIIVKNIPNGYDAATLSNNTYKYSSIGLTNIVSATFVNNGFTPITALSINYKIGANPAISETQTLVTPLAYLESKQLTFSVPFLSSTPAFNTVKIWSGLINGVADQLNSNDTLIGSLTITSSIPAKKVLVEEFTGTWCGWCPEGQAYLNSAAFTNSNAVVVSLHDEDNMSSVSGNSLIADYANTFPSATIDQYLFPSKKSVSLERNDWNLFIAQRQSMIVPASVAITGVSYNSSTREIKATVSSSFLGDVKGDYRLNLYIKENNVFGAIADSLLDNNWNQHSYLYNISSSPYYQLGNYLNPTTYLMGSNRYMHRNVLDSLLDGPYGASGIIPLSGSTNGQTYDKAYTYTLTMPVGTEYRYHEENIYLIGLLTEYNSDTKQRAVLNVAETKLNLLPEAVGIKEQTQNDFKFNMYPNPTSSTCKLNYILKDNAQITISIFNVLGVLVYSEIKTENAGNVFNELPIFNLPQGNYSVELSSTEFKTVKKLTIIK